MSFIIAVAIIFFSCSDNSKSDGDGQSRIDYVESLPYRSLSADSLIVQDILHDADQILAIFGTKSEQLLVLKLKSDTLKVATLQSSDISINELRSKSYQLWKENNLTATYLLYTSTSQNTVTAKLDTISVIEIEDARLTGTCRIFIKSDTRSLSENFQYYERN